MVVEVAVRLGLPWVHCEAWAPLGTQGPGIQGYGQFWTPFNGYVHRDTVHTVGSSLCGKPLLLSFQRDKPLLLSFGSHGPLLLLNWRLFQQAALFHITNQAQA